MNAKDQISIALMGAMVAKPALALLDCGSVTVARLQFIECVRYLRVLDEEITRLVKEEATT